MPFRPVQRILIAAFLVLQAFGPEMQEAVAGTASAVFRVTAHLVGATPQCRGNGEPLSLACGSPRTPTYLETRPDLQGSFAQDGWLAEENRTQAYGSVYAASLTTRLVRYQQWEYVETLVSW